MVMSRTLSQGDNEINLSVYGSGMYLLQFQFAGNTEVRKIVLN